LTKNEHLLNLTLVLPKKQHKKTMALLEEIEPPSYTHTAEKIKNLRPKADQPLAEKLLDQNKNQLVLTGNKWMKLFLTKSFNLTRKLTGNVKILFNNSIKSVGNFVLSNKYLPHCALLALGLLVAVSNIGEKLRANAYYQDIVSTGPDAEFAVASAVDQYTPLISNGPEIVQKAIAASASSDGFTSATGSVATVITAREEPLPDNSAQTVQYTVKNGDTLSTLGMKFNVKIATLKYLNDISDVDMLKPGATIKIPQKGYEVPASAIAKKENDKKAKLATAQRNTVARSATTSRYSTSTVATINGVRYVRKANSNEMQCYTYVTSQGYGVGGYGLARFIPTNSNSPKVGGLVVTYESWAGHVAIVTGVNDDGTFNIRESNYTHGWITERTMSLSSRGIKGFVN